MKTLANKSFSTQKGFTLIELVVVIVILGILAATAAPKFIDLTSDAKVSVMKGVEGSIESAISMVHAKAIIDGKTTSTDGKNTIEIDGKHYALVYGYPAAKSLGDGDGASAASALGILGLVDLDAADFTTTTNTATTQVIQHKDATGTACQLSYADSGGANTRPIITATLDNC